MLGYVLLNLVLISTILLQLYLLLTYTTVYAFISMDMVILTKNGPCNIFCVDCA
jgi:hypothetical protein